MSKASKITPAVLTLAIALCGCSVFRPKNVELFQKKVRPVPDYSADAQELAREAALRASQKAQETLIAAVAAQAPTNVVAPAKDTVALTDAVSTFFGPPSDPPKPTEPVAPLVERVIAEAGEKHEAIEKYAKATQELAGQKIEGTGLIRVPYLSFLAGSVAFVVVGLTLFRILFPALASVGGSLIRISATRVAAALRDVVDGGERFKQAVGKLSLSEEARAAVLDAFRRAHSEAQDRDTKEIVRRLTN